MGEKNDRKRGCKNIQYGEFMSSYFSWISPNKQRKNAKKLENITKKQENDKK